MADVAPKPPKKKRRKRRSGALDSFLLWIDRWLVQLSAGAVVGVWLYADIRGLTLSEGTRASLGAFVAYALIKSRADNKWRAVELQKSEMEDLIGALEKFDPKSREAIEVRRRLVELAKQAHDESEEEKP